MVKKFCHQKIVSSQKSCILKMVCWKGYLVEFKNETGNLIGILDIECNLISHIKKQVFHVYIINSYIGIKFGYCLISIGK